jgi:hypothetical protein
MKKLMEGNFKWSTGEETKNRPREWNCSINAHLFHANLISNQNMVGWTSLVKHYTSMPPFRHHNQSPCLFCTCARWGDQTIYRNMPTLCFYVYIMGAFGRLGRNPAPRRQWDGRTCTSKTGHVPDLAHYLVICVAWVRTEVHVVSMPRKSVPSVFSHNTCLVAFLGT